MLKKAKKNTNFFEYLKERKSFKLLAYSLVCILLIIAGYIFIHYYEIFGSTSNYQAYESSQDEILPIFLSTDEQFNNDKVRSLSDITAGKKVEDWNVDCITFDKLSLIGDMCKLEDHLYLTDTDKNVIVKTDLKGNILKQVGSAGNDLGEFLTPTLITNYHDEIFVVDEGNHRIQVLSTDLIPKKEIRIPSINNNPTEILSFAVNAHGIYLNNDFYYTVTLLPFDYDSQTNTKNYSNVEETKPIIKNFYGSLYVKNDNEILGINFLTARYDKDSDQLNMQNGRNWILGIKNIEAKILCELPKFSGINTFALDGNNIISYSLSWNNVLDFNLQGQTQSVLTDQLFKYPEIESYFDQNKSIKARKLLKVESQHEYWLLIYNQNKIIRIFK